MIEYISKPLDEQIKKMNYGLPNLSDEWFHKYSLNKPRDILSLEKSIFDSNNYFLFPLESAISAPLIFRNTHYRNFVLDGHTKWSTMVERILTEGEKSISIPKGHEFATNWYYDLRKNIDSLINSGNPNKIVLDDNGIGFSKIGRQRLVGNTAHIDDLLLNLGNGDYLPIAKREVKDRYETFDSRLSKFVPENESYLGLVNGLKELESIGKNYLFQHHHHLFTWFGPTIGHDDIF